MTDPEPLTAPTDKKEGVIYSVSRENRKASPTGATERAYSQRYF